MTMRSQQDGLLNGLFNGSFNGLFNTLFNRLFIRVGISVLLLGFVLGGCSRPTAPVTELVLDPRLSATKQLEGDLYSREPGQAISPGGHYLLAEQSDGKGFHMVAVSLADGASDVVLNTVGEGEAGDSYIRQTPLGWMSPTSCVFLVHGKHEQGPHEGKYGVAIMAADVTTRKAEEIGFIESPSGSFNMAAFVEDASKVYVHVPGVLWEIDLRDESLRLVKGDLPTYDGLFIVRVSPVGRYAVYEMYEPDKEGIYILDIATGEERPLLTTGATKSFLPQWSPDGKYIMAYTAGQKPDGANLPAWERYEVLEGEDSLLPMASRLTIVTPEGEVRKTVEVAGKVLAHARWAPDSTAIGFLTGVPRAEGGQSLPPDQRPGALSYESAMIAGVSGEEGPVSVADLRELPGFEDPSVDLVFVGPSGDGLYFVASTLKDSSLQGSEIWYGSKDGEPVKVCDGSWLFAGTEPVYDDHVVGVVSLDDQQSVWMVGPDGSRLLAESDNPQSWTTILGYDEGVLVVGNRDYSGATNTSTVQVFRMYNEVEVGK